MAVTATSRYASGTITVVEDPQRGQHQAIIPADPVDRSFAFTFYQFTDGDTVDMLGYQFFGAGQLWWMLADLNPEILDWNNVAVGTVLRVPYV